MTKAKVQIAGWFSLSGGHDTIGDNLSLRCLCDALTEAGVAYEVRLPHDGPVDDHPIKVWVSGPVDRSYAPQHALLGNGVDWIFTSTTLITDRSDTGAADISTARDGTGVPTRADFAYLLPPKPAGTFAALLLRGLQPEYRATVSHHEAIRTTVHNAVLQAGMYPVFLNTRIEGAASPVALGAGLERVMATATVTITSRLHGILHSLRAGTVPIVIDEVPNGGKVTAFVREFNLPVLIEAKECTVDRVISAIDAVRGIDSNVAGSILGKATDSARNNLDCVVSLIMEKIANIS